MGEPSEIVDANFGKLSLDDESTYFAEVPWKYGMSIRLFINVYKKNHRQCIERAWEVFSAVRKNELEILRQGISDVDVDVACIDEFLDNELTERTIQIFADGEGQINYYLFGLGTFMVSFSCDAAYIKALAIPC